MTQDSENNENILSRINDLFCVLKFDKEKIEKLSKDNSSIATAFLMTMSASLLSVLGVSFIPIEILDSAIEFNLTTIIRFAFINFIFEIASIFLIAFLAKFLFKAKGEILSFFKVAGSVNLVKFLNIIPLFSLFTSIWYFALQVTILQKLYNMNRLPAIADIIVSTLFITLVALWLVS